VTGPDPDQQRLTRRQAMRRGAAGALTLSSLPALLAACGGDDDDAGGAAGETPTTTASAGPTPADQVKGDLVLLGYPDWYGPTEFKDFAAKYPGATVKNSPGGLSGQAQQIAQLSQNKGDFDLTLAGINVSEQMKLAGLIAPFDPATVPNVAKVGEPFRKAYPYGIPTDFGKTGFGYRKDLIKERPTTWEELWTLAAKYKGRTTMLKYDSDIQGVALRALGFSINTKEESELEAMQKHLLEIKPNLKAIIDTDYSKALIQGTAYFAIDYDYDIAVAQQENENIEWVQPEEGVPAYLEGWIGLKDSKNLPTVWAFMDFHLDPKNYASFINATGSAYVMKEAEPFIKKEITSNPTLAYAPDKLAEVEFEGYLGPEQTAKRGKLWEEFLSA
jgi:spermidine/putrescine transport system substrate-binding protein